jgi:hypothetical protein
MSKIVKCKRTGIGKIKMILDVGYHKRGGYKGENGVESRIEIFKSNIAERKIDYM